MYRACLAVMVLMIAADSLIPRTYASDLSCVPAVNSTTTAAHDVPCDGSTVDASQSATKAP